MDVFPEPGCNASPVGTTARVTLGPGEKATIRFEPSRSSTTFYIPAVAISKLAGTRYSIFADDEAIWGPDEGIPPTDIDDLSAAFIPSETFESTLRVEIADVRASGDDRIYHVQPVGWEQ